jgi:hypothetical protein
LYFLKGFFDFVGVSSEGGKHLQAFRSLAGVYNVNNFTLIKV